MYIPHCVTLGVNLSSTEIVVMHQVFSCIPMVNMLLCASCWSHIRVSLWPLALISLVSDGRRTFPCTQMYQPFALHPAAIKSSQFNPKHSWD